MAAAPAAALIVATKGNELRGLPDAAERMAAVETIRAFSEADLNVAHTAERMHVHPNTLRYRLPQIATKTGHDPRTFSGLVDPLCIVEMADDVEQP